MGRTVCAKAGTSLQILIRCPAISTLLQPPIVRTGLVPHTNASLSGSLKAPTSRDIPPVTLTNIPTVEVAAFKPYLTQVGALYDALLRAKESEDENNSLILRRGSKVDEFADFLDQERRSSKAQLSRRESLASLASSVDASTPVRRKLNREGSRRSHAPTPLSTIPPVYFDVVSERSEVVRPVPGTPDERKGANGTAAGPRKALATNAILQEKLSWYMDTVEVHLISSISAASSSFFAALGSLRELHAEAAESVDRIKSLREELEALDKEMAVAGLEVVSKKRRKENLKQLSDTIQQLKRIVSAIADCETLVDEGHVEKALQAIESLEKLIAGQRSNVKADDELQLRDLRGAAALQGVTSDLSTLRYRIGRTYESRLLADLSGDLKDHVQNVSLPEILQRWSNASNRGRGGHNREPSAHPKYLVIADDFRSKLRVDLGGLKQSQHVAPAITAYRESVLKEVRNIIRRPLPASNDDDADSMMSASTIGGGRKQTAQEKSSVLARNLRALDVEDAEQLLKTIYVGLTETLRRAGTQMKILLDVTSSLEEGPSAVGMRSPPRSPNMAAIDGRLSPAPRDANSQDLQEEMHRSLDMANLLSQAVDVAQEKIVKILKVRSEQSLQMNVEQFLRYFTLNLLFANECEAISGRSGTALKNLVNSQIKDFVRQVGESERQTLATGMEADPWNAKDFSDFDNEVLTRVLLASTRDAEAWTTSGRIWLPYTQPVPDTNGSAETPAPASTNAKDTTRPAVIEDEQFVLPASAMLCLHGVASLLHLNAGIPSVTNDVATSIVSYLALFNSRCTQLILGAGATRSAGLKNITTKHLALAARSLAFISNLIPHLREFIRRHAGTGTSVSLTMGEFDKVRRSYLEHQQSIFDKLVDMMSGRVLVSAKAMKNINWEDPDTDEVSPYMITLTRDTSTLHKVLNKHLPEMTARMIMDSVFQSYKEQWGRAFGDVVLQSEDARWR
jgi:vacuolar protein sorting-associated protein 54